VSSVDDATGVERRFERSPSGDGLEDPGLLGGDELGATTIGDIAGVDEHAADRGLISEQHRY